MKTEVTLDDQPLAFIRRQQPAARRKLREALHAIERGEAFPEPLEDELDGFHKVNVGDYRMLLQAVSAPRGPRFRVVFAEKRSAVYVLFSQILGLE
jgi:mRNA-degrading endonuclease RelE of RelBE toxin-antitoxin system